MTDVERALWMRHHPYGDAAVITRELADVGDGLPWPTAAADGERLWCSFSEGHSTSFYGAGSQWTEIYRDVQAELVAELLAGGQVSLVDALRDACDNNLFYGFEDLYRDTTARYRTDPNQRVAYAWRCHDLLLRLAEALGLRPLENPEGGRWGEHLDADDAELVSQIEAALGIPISVPPVAAGYYGLQTSRGVVTERSLNAVYSAYRIQQAVAHLEAPAVLEIGGGLGHVARYAWLLGVRDYTIVDLPLTGIAQGYFLLRTLGSEHVALQGEARRPAVQVKLAPPSLLDRCERVDLVFNIDGFTEYGEATARAYLDRIRAASPTFLSINHEANGYRVRAVTPPGDQVLRFPYWLRNGYVEEIISFAG